MYKAQGEAVKLVMYSYKMRNLTQFLEEKLFTTIRQ